VRSQELKMAGSLIDSMTVDFDQDEYHDNYREALQELVDAKAEGREVIQPEETETEGEPVSLAEALKASLSAAKDPGGAGRSAGGSAGNGSKTSRGKSAAGSKSAASKSTGGQTKSKSTASKESGSAASRSRSRRKVS
jgi:DNA end-binding protein Ku